MQKNILIIFFMILIFGVVLNSPLLVADSYQNPITFVSELLENPDSYINTTITTEGVVEQLSLRTRIITYNSYFIQDGNDRILIGIYGVVESVGTCSPEAVNCTEPRTMGSYVGEKVRLTGKFEEYPTSYRIPKNEEFSKYWIFTGMDESKVIVLNDDSKEGNITEIEIERNGRKINIKARGINATRLREAMHERNRLRFGGGSELPENCTRTGVVIKCDTEGGRIMTVMAGQSGNTIIQVKGVNATTKVQLYHHNGKVYGLLNNNETKLIDILPDQIREKIRERIQAKLAENETIELDEEGNYKVRLRKRVRILGIIPAKENMNFQIDPETGEVIKQKGSWWGFLARDVEENSKENWVGGCGTVTPGMEDECCQNLGYDFWNSEILECE